MGQTITPEPTTVGAAGAAPGRPLVIAVPAWIDELASRFGGFADDESRMDLAVALSRENVERGGGPFAAAVFAGDRLVAVGVNLVLQSGFSIAHAEIVALTRAQQRAQQQPGDRDTMATTMATTMAPTMDTMVAPAPLCLVTTTEPCCQCFGAIVWSGISRLVCAATTSDAERIGFDEGPKPAEWPDVLERRGISVTLGVRSAEAAAVLEEYARRGGPIYGLRHPVTR